MRQSGLVRQFPRRVVVGCTSLVLPVGGWWRCRSWVGSTDDMRDSEGRPSKAEFPPTQTHQLVSRESVIEFTWEVDEGRATRGRIQGFRPWRREMSRQVPQKEQQDV